MKNQLTQVLEQLCELAFMDEFAASAFLTEQIDSGKVGNGWLLLALAWIDPPEAQKRSGRFERRFGEVSNRIRALQEARELYGKDDEEKAAYHVLAALRSGDPREASRYQLVCQYLPAMESLEAFVGASNWAGLPDIPLLFHLCKELPQEVESALAHGTHSSTLFWKKIFCLVRLLLLTQEKAPADSAELVRLIRLHRLTGGEAYHDAEAYVMARAVDYLEQSEPERLPELLPDLQPYCHAAFGSSRLYLRARVLTLIVPGTTDYSALKPLLDTGLQNRNIRKSLNRWDRRIGGVVSKLPLSKERTHQFAQGAIIRLWHIAASSEEQE